MKKKSTEYYGASYIFFAFIAAVNLFCFHYSRRKVEYQPIFKKTKKIEKSACILRESLVS